MGYSLKKKKKGFDNGFHCDIYIWIHIKTLIFVNLISIKEIK